MEKSKFITFIFVLAGSVSGLFSYDITSGDYNLHGADKDSLIIQQMLEYTKEAENINKRFFKISLTQPVDIYLAPSDEAYLKFNAPAIPEWSSGIAYHRARKIIMKPGSYFDPVRYRETLIHEIVHIYIGDVLGGEKIPVWMNEGTAMLLAGKELTWQEHIDISNALSAAKIPDLVAIDSLLLFPDIRAQRGYLASFLAVQYFVRNYGLENLAALIRDAGGELSLDTVFLLHTGQDFFTFELNWYQDLKDRYRWMFFLHFDTLYWSGLIIIIMIALIVRYVRNKRIYSRWENEDIV